MATPQSRKSSARFRNLWNICSDPKGFHEKMMCKISGDSVSSVTSDKPKKEGNGFWQKIKNFGGKNINEPG